MTHSLFTKFIHDRRNVCIKGLGKAIEGGDERKRKKCSYRIGRKSGKNFENT